MTAIEKIQTVITPLNSVEKINEIIDQVNNLKTGEFATTEFVLDNCYKPPLLSFMWADHLLNDMSWLRADTFSWQDGTTYSLIYNELLSEYNNSASVSETEGSITFKRTPKGYKIALATQETAIAEKYATDGIAWYYILDTTNQRFKLPRMKHKYWKDQTTIPVMGNGMTMGITDGVKNKGLTYITTYGYYSYATNNTNVPVGTTVSGSGVGFNGSTAVGLSKDSTQSGVVADVSDVNIETGFYLYFYVGGFTKSAEAQTAGLKAELLNGKADVNTPSIQAPYLKDSYVNGTSGYNIWSNGYCEQWGRVTYGTQGNVTVTLLKQMIDTNYCCQVTLYGDTVGFHAPANPPYWQAWNMTTSSFQTYRYSAATMQQMWRVLGYLAEGEY